MKALCLLVACMVLSACVNPGVPIKMYAGSDKPVSELVTLLPPGPNTASMVLWIDGEKTSSCAISCMFYGPVQILPGKHNFSSSNFKTPRSPVESSSTIPTEAHEAKDVSEKLLFDAYEFDFDATLSAGKQYRFQFAISKKQDGKPRPYVWWQEVVPN